MKLQYKKYIKKTSRGDAETQSFNSKALFSSSAPLRLCEMVFLIIFLLFIFSCSRSALNDKLLIVVSIPPQAWFVSQIAGDNTEVIVLVPPGQNPHNYEPTPRQIRTLTSAKTWILSGTEFEISLRPKIEALFPDLLIVDGTEHVDFRLLTHHELHDCDHDHDHSSLEIDRHTWLGRIPAIKLINTVTQTLYRFDQENGDIYFERMNNTIWDINNVFDELKILLAPLYGKSVFVYHPSFGYFFDEFNIYQEAVETGGKEPTPRQLNLLIEKMIEEKPAAIFVQTQFPVNAARTIANTAGAQVLEMDPLAADWLENIRRMGETLQKAIP